MPPQTISPGAGFSGATTPSPAGPIGAGRYSDCKAIARWNTAPFQTISASFVVGVVAFHGAEIDQVEFFLDGGTVVVVSAMELNSDTDTWEYCVTVNAAALSDGLHELRAIVYPNKGYPRQLQGNHDTSTAAQSRGEHSFWFYSNANATLPTTTMWVDVNGHDDTGDGTEGNPYKLISIAFVAGVTALSGDPSGLTIRMKSAGSYGYPNTFTPYDNGRMIVVEGNPALDPEDCVIDTMDSNPPRGFQSQHVTFRNCTIGAVQGLNDSNDCMVYTEDVIIAGDVYTDFVSPFGRSAWTLGIYHKNVTFHDMNTAMSDASLTNNYEIYNVGEDCIRDCQGLFTNGYVHDTRQVTGGHADLMQFFNGLGANDEFENTIFFGLRAVRVGTSTEGVQGIFWRNLFAVGAHQDLAFVNCDVGAAGNSQGLHSANHVLFWYCSFHTNYTAGIGGAWLFADDPPDSPTTTIANLSIRNTVVKSFSVSCGTDPVYTSPRGTEVWMDNCHLIDNTCGTNNTTGSTEAALYADPSSGDFSPKAAGPLTSRVATPLVPVDALNSTRGNNGSIGAYEFGASPPGVSTWYFIFAGGLSYPIVAVD